MEPISVLLTTEGTYPCYQGGVSVWCDKLIEILPDVRFHVFALAGQPNAKVVFPPQPNVESCQIFPIWGTEEAGRPALPFSQVHRRKIATTPEVIRAQFLPAFEAVASELLSPSCNAEVLAGGLADLSEYFDRYDYAASMTAPETWDSFLPHTHKVFPSGGSMTVEDATECLRWTARYLAVLTADLPRVDIVHASMAGLAAIPGLLCRKRYGTRFLITEHGIYLRELHIALAKMKVSQACRRFLLRLNESIVKTNYAFADQVTSLCDFNRKWQARLGADPARVRLIPNGVDGSRFSPAGRSEADRPTVVTLARLFALKGITVLLRAVSIVREQIPNVRFRILGEASDEAYYEECMQIVREHNLAPNLEFGVSTTPAAEYLTAHLCCVPSISEAMPYVVLEAMFSGCPVVATGVGCVPGLLANTGLVVKPNDPAALAEGLLSLLAPEPEAAQRRQSLAALALNRARSEFTLERMARNYRSLYEELYHAERIDSSLAATR